MSHHRIRSGIPQAPPPPTLNDSHSSRDSHSRHSRSRSRSPPPRSRGSGSSISRPRYDEDRRGYMDSRDRERDSRRRSPGLYGSSSVVKEEPASSSSHPTYISSSHDPRSTHHPQINRIPPQDPTDGTIVRTIISPENVRIPRRENEGLRPIFDREELREAIKRRIESGDNDQNPSNPEQRVVAIIREPLPMAPQYMQQEIIPILPPGFLQDQMIQQPQPQGRFETSAGVSYTFEKNRSRSRSAGRPEHRGKDREHDRRVVSPDRRDRRARHGSEEFRSARRAVRRSRSRTSSPVTRVDRVRSVKSYTLRSTSRSPESEIDQSRELPWNDLRECLNGHRSDRIQLAKAYANAAEESSTESDQPKTKIELPPPRKKSSQNPGTNLVDSMVRTSRRLNGTDYKQLMIRLFDKRKPESSIAGIWRHWEKGIRLRKIHRNHKVKKRKTRRRKRSADDKAETDDTSSEPGFAIPLSKTRRRRIRAVSPEDEVITCWHCNQAGHHRDVCKIRLKEMAETQGKVWTTTRCIHCNRMGHYSENCWYKDSEKPQRRK